MTDNIKMPPMPEWAKMDNLNGMVPSEIRSELNQFAREAVRLNATVPDAKEMFNAGWCAAARFCDREDVVYDGLVGPSGCPAFESTYRDAWTALSAAPAAPKDNRCAQCNAPYKKGAHSIGCPKCATGREISEAEFRKPVGTKELCPSCKNGGIYACTCTFNKYAPAAPQPAQPLTDEQIAKNRGVKND